jgi:hypothetical protein
VGPIANNAALVHRSKSTSPNTRLKEDLELTKEPNDREARGYSMS